MDQSFIRLLTRSRFTQHMGFFPKNKRQFKFLAIVVLPCKVERSLVTSYFVSHFECKYGNDGLKGKYV